MIGSALITTLSFIDNSFMDYIYLLVESQIGLSICNRYRLINKLIEQRC